MSITINVSHSGKVKVKDAEEKWITVRGVHVKIDGNGKILTGPTSLKGSNIKTIGGKTTNQEIAELEEMLDKAKLDKDKHAIAEIEEALQDLASKRAKVKKEEAENIAKGLAQHTEQTEAAEAKFPKGTKVLVPQDGFMPRVGEVIGHRGNILETTAGDIHVTKAKLAE